MCMGPTLSDPTLALWGPHFVLGPCLKNRMCVSYLFAFSALTLLVWRQEERLKKRKGKERSEFIYSAFIVATTLKALRRGSHSFTCK